MEVSGAGAALIGHRDKRPMNGLHDTAGRGTLTVNPRPHRGRDSGRTQFLAWTAWVVLALLGLD
jgi:hypothetical protein